MISIELHIPTISLAAFVCFMVALAPGVLSILLSISYYKDDLHIVSATLGGLLIISGFCCLACAIFPQRMFLLTVDLLSWTGILSVGCVWICKRMIIHKPFPMLEIPCVILWILTVVLMGVFLTIAITEVIYLNHQKKLAESQMYHLPVIDTKSSQLTIISSQFRFGSGSELTKTDHGPNQQQPPTTVIPDLAFESDTPTTSNQTAKQVKKHKSSSSFLSFFSQQQPESNVQKPIVKAHHKSDSFLGRLHPPRLTSHLRTHQSMSGLDQLQHPTYDPNSIGFDWETNSLGIKDRLEWSLSTLDHTQVQSRNVSQSSNQSKASTSTFTTTFNRSINSAGFAKDVRSFRRSTPTRRIPSDSEGWRFRPVEPESEYDQAISQYDRERLMMNIS
jgi:hypothetical protein